MQITLSFRRLPGRFLSHCRWLDVTKRRVRCLIFSRERQVHL
jgi:hypothetical protein